MNAELRRLLCLGLGVAAGCGSRSGLYAEDDSSRGRGGGGTGGSCGAGVEVLSFAPQAVATTGAAPTDLRLADFDGDGHLDVAVANRSSDTVGVHLGQGDGSLAAQASFNAAKGPILLTVADMDLDGSPDVVTADEASVSVLLGDGNGGLEASLSFDVCEVPLALASGDVSGDGLADVAVWCAQDTTTRVLKNAGDGTLTALTTWPFQGGLGIAFGDLNGDGALDMVQSGPENAISVSLNQGDGQFDDGGTYAVEKWPYPVALVDLNGDQDLDVITGTSLPDDTALSVLLGQGNGSLQPAMDFMPSCNMFSAQFMDTGDLDGDGHLDVAAAMVSGEIKIVFGLGDGTFTLPQTITMSTWASGLAVGDMNGDGKPDLVGLMNPGHPDGSPKQGMVQVLLNTTP